MEDIFSQFGDIFGGHFGFGGFGGGGRGRRVNRGTDLRVKVKLNLKEILPGVENNRRADPDNVIVRDQHIKCFLPVFAIDPGYER